MLFRSEIDQLKERKSDDPFILKLRGLLDRLKRLEINEKVETLKIRESDDPFIPELRSLQEKLTLLEDNRQIESLLSRKSDDPFIGSLRDKELELIQLEGIHIDPEPVSVMQVQKTAFPSFSPIKPKRKLIVVLGAVLGLMLGIFGAFFLNFLENQKQYEE